MNSILKYYFLFIILISFACSQKTTSKSIIGKYESSNLNTFEYIKYYPNKNIKGIRLNLKKDSTYFYKTCGLLINGQWSIEGKILSMAIDSIRYANDSINKIKKPEIRKDFFIFKINTNTLVGKVNVIDGVRINKLVKK